MIKKNAKKTTPSPKASNTEKPKRPVAKKAAVKDIKEPKEYSFFQDVYDVVRHIPKGRVTSYGAIAAYLGTRLSARMVGWAMNAADKAKPKIHAQRVVNSKGLLSGKMHFGTPTRMEELLKKDGVTVKDDQVVDFANRFWDPAKELGW
jgi:methylated-DNA-protein-cysteine methyltransferase related protein